MEVNKKAVSSVIGTMLMVTVVIILSVTIAGFVFGMAYKVKSSP